MDGSLKYKIALSLIPNIGDILAKRLVAYCGSAEAIFREKKSMLEKIPGIGTSKINDIIKKRHITLLIDHLEKVSSLYRMAASEAPDNNEKSKM